MGYKPQNIEPGAYPFPRKQVPLDAQKSYADRIDDILPRASRHPLEPVNIGFAADPLKHNRHPSKRPELEPLARRRQLKISCDDVHKVDADLDAPRRRQQAAIHYGVFDDLFGEYHRFYPAQDVPIFFSQKNSETVSPIYCGNVISADIALTEPLIEFGSFPKSSLWTLVMTSPDEPIPSENGDKPNEYIHWMVCNIAPEVSEDGLPKSGDLIVDYLPPLPYCGTGFHRYVFALYHQDQGKIDLSKYTRSRVKENYHTERSFNTADFYREHQDELTPAGLAFFQSCWSPAVREYLREHLPGTSEPVFDVEFPHDLPPPQSRFPLANSWFHPRRHPSGLPLANSRLGVHEDTSFDIYLDRYRDRREMDTEVVQHRLNEEGNPMESAGTPPARSPYPLASPPLPSNRAVPSWWRQQEIQRRLRKGRWAKLDGFDD